MASSAITRLVALSVIVLVHAFLTFLSWGILYGAGHQYSPTERDTPVFSAAEAVNTVMHLPLLVPLEATHVGRQVIHAVGPLAYLLNSVLAVGSVAILWWLWRRRRPREEPT